MRGLRKLCDTHQLLLIVDEVQTGCGRTGTLFAYEHDGVEPDIMTLGKGLGGGVPLSALLAKEACSCFEAGDQGGTFCGNPLMCAVGVAVMRSLLAPSFLESSRSVSAQLADGLRQLAQEFGLGEVRGRGALLALELGCDIAPQLVELARARGLLLNAPRSHCLRFMPALNTTPDEVREGLGTLRQVLEKMLNKESKPAVDVSPGLTHETLDVCVFDDHAHRAQVTSLWRQVFGYETAHNAPSLAIDRKLAVADGLFFVAINAGRVVGTVMAGYDGHRGWLYAVAVHPSYQKKGVGSSLIAHAERALTAKGCLKINLQIVASNERVAGFYSTLGYVVEKRISMGNVLYP
jgi:ribosomal protein S18 acetylase RimI-like enzyme